MKICVVKGNKTPTTIYHRFYQTMIRSVFLADALTPAPTTPSHLQSLFRSHKFIQQVFWEAPTMSEALI